MHPTAPREDAPPSPPFAPLGDALLPPESRLSPAELRQRRSMKWATHGEDVLPAFVAEMDLAPPLCVQEAIADVAARGDYGYPPHLATGAPHPLALAHAARMAALYGFEPEPDLGVPVADLVQALYLCVAAFTDPGDCVLIQEPIYPPIRAAVLDQGRQVATLPMRADGQGPALSAAELDARLPNRTRLLLLCNPHNPTGHVATRPQLDALASLCLSRDMVVVSDEIHADLVFDGRAHVPLAALGAEIGACTVTLVSGTKAFNIPALSTGLMQFGSGGLKQRFAARIPLKGLGLANAFGVAATLAGWARGDEWLDRLRTYLQAARDHVQRRLAAEAPGIGFAAPQATYMAWLDLSALDLPGPAASVLLERGRIALSAGERFLPGGTAFARFNFAAAPELLDPLVDALVAACRTR